MVQECQLKLLSFLHLLWVPCFWPSLSQRHQQLCSRVAFQGFCRANSHGRCSDIPWSKEKFVHCSGEWRFVSLWGKVWLSRFALRHNWGLLISRPLCSDAQTHCAQFLHLSPSPLHCCHGTWGPRETDMGMKPKLPAMSFVWPRNLLSSAITYETAAH